ncbi:hypothetical protein EJB05_22803 [Eragrostis curvula]|uniref:AAA+ ATPase domain-containing protein n=1 Tax=Eragrostis curvula TaxID=38414 RepID=A0A5J9V4L4_9POAL|nr:hypothetical protein EJB05_22803 [Eragrostis curvula]
MAVVLDALASFVKHMLTEMAKAEVSMLLGVSREIGELEGKLLELKDALADADRRRITDKLVQRWVGVLKDAMYEATDILDLCKLKAEERRESAMGGDPSRRFNSILFCMRNPVFAHDIGRRLKKLNKRLDGICRSSQTFGFVRTVGDQGWREVRPRPPTAAVSKTSPVMERLSLVGAKIEEDTMTLVDMMTKEGGTSRAEGNTMMVIAIAGIGGIGKTALARNIYNHQAIGDKFPQRIWLSVTQNATETELLREAIDQAREEHCCHPHVTSNCLTLVNIIRDKKVFLVLDDMWSVAEWNNVLKAPFSYAAPGSRVLVTTRLDGVARAMGAGYLHRIDFLGLQDAWSLLKKQVVATERDMIEIETLKHIGFEILGRCGGLPLAIKVIGGLLRQRDMNIVEWERVLNNPAWSIGGMPDELNHAIYLSYDDLPPHLKQCLVYCSFFPIRCHDPMVQMWIGEGLVSSSCSDNLEEIGADYIEKLTLRNLMEPNQELGGQHYVMHDVVRSFCLYIARDEVLLAEDGETDIGNRLGSQEFRVLSIGHKAGSGELEWNVLQKQRSLRTLITFCPMKFNPGDSLSRLSSLRTVIIDGADFSKLAGNLSQLKHLRYLSITNPETSRLPEDIGKMRFLQHISLFGCVKMARLPRSIVKLKQLRYLNLIGTSINSVPRGFAELTNLRIISDFPAHVDADSNGWCTLEELGPLSQLRNLGLTGLENVHPSSLATKAMLCSKRHIVNLRLACRSSLGDDISEEEQQRIEEVFDELCPASCINYLTIRSYFGRRLPNWMMSQRAEVPLERLKFLLLQNLAFCPQLPDGLCQLPCLETIEIHWAPAIKRVGTEFLRCCNHPSRSSALGAFPRLNKLVMDRLLLWEAWEWEEQVEAMPVLEELVLHTCRLTQLPSGLAFHARALKILTLHEVHRLVSLENLPSVVELDVSCCHELKGIANLPSLHRLVISCCPELQALDGVLELRRLILRDGRGSVAMLPDYLADLNLAHLTVCCGLGLLCSMALGNNTPEWDKFCHIPRVEAFSKNKFRVSYTRDPRYLDTNISPLLYGIPRFISDDGKLDVRSM